MTLVRHAQPGDIDEAPSKAQTGEDTRLRIITHNIRYATSAPFKGEEKWPIRCPLLCAELVFNAVASATFICLQEVLHSQLLDIQGDLGEEPSVWKVHKWDTVWLSETPRVPSKGWDATSYRIATIGHFVHAKSGKKVIITSTHFDNDGAKSRRESAKLLPEILELEAAHADATILAGDFNSPPDDDAYQIVTGKDSTLVDIWDLIPKEKRYGNENTFTGFSGEDEQTRIDFIFARKSDVGKGFYLDTYGVLPNRFDDGVYSSDHRAVVVDGHFS